MAAHYRHSVVVCRDCTGSCRCGGVPVQSAAEATCGSLGQSVRAIGTQCEGRGWRIEQWREKGFQGGNAAKARANDFDTTPGTDISAELDRLHKSHLLKIYPVIGKTSGDGHSLLYLGISEWEPDLFQFLDDNEKH